MCIFSLKYELAPDYIYIIAGVFGQYWTITVLHTLVDAIPKNKSKLMLPQ